MTLATAILLFGITLNQTVSQPAGANSSTTAQASPQESSPTTPQAPPAETKPSPAPANKPATAGQKATKTKKRVHKKKAAASGCETVPSTGNSETSASSTPTPNAPAADPADVSKNCPPEKIIVRHGGASEPSIQLAGGSGGDQASQQRDAANQMLGSTEANLKKISGLQLSAAQQDSISQIRQFVDQAKAALAAGDLERGHTLAWKAQLLSEDLVNPQK